MLTVKEAHEKCIESKVIYTIETIGGYEHIEINRTLDNYLNGSYAEALDKIELFCNREITYINYNKAEQRIEFASYLED